MIINIISPHASNYLGGMEAVTINMAIHLARQGETIRFFTRKSTKPTDTFHDMKHSKPDGLHIIEIELIDCPLPDSTWPTFYKISNIFGATASSEYDKFADADLFITHLSIDALYVPKRSKSLLHLHGNPDTADSLMDKAIQLPNSTIAHSQSIKSWWSNQYPHLKPSIFLNGIDASIYTGDPTSKRPIDVLYVGRFLEHKGIDDILRTVDKTTKVVLAGHGPYLPVIKSIVAERNLKHVTILEKPSTKVVKKLYRDSKVFACPSRSKEGLLTTLLEASASGCAIVTTSGSGMTDLIDISAKESIIISPGDINSLGVALADLLADNDYRSNTAQRLQSKIKAGWSWEQKTKELIEIYRHAL